MKTTAIAAVLAILCATSVPVEAETPACDKAMATACGADRHLGLIPCAECMGVHEADIQKQGCGQSDIAEFCSNLTCATKLTDRCGSSASCSGCTKCAGNVRACNDHPVVQSNFCDTSCAQELRCTLKAVELCNPSDITQCAVCTGVNADALHAARCSGDQLESFCKKQLCIPKLANKCSHTNESNGTCLDCAACSQRNRGSTHCRSADEEAYCNLIVPPRKHGPSCRATLEHYCEASRQKGFFECVQCSGKYHRSVLAANCTSQETGAFCKIPYKIASPCLAAIANLCNTSASGAATSSCGTCTSCVTKAAQALYKTGITCPVDELSDFCDSGCPNGTFVWTNNTHDEEQTPHCVVPDDGQQWYLGLNGQSCSDICAARGDSCATGDKYSEVTDAAMLTGIAKSLNHTCSHIYPPSSSYQYPWYSGNVDSVSGSCYLPPSGAKEMCTAKYSNRRRFCKCDNSRPVPALGMWALGKTQESCDGACARQGGGMVCDTNGYWLTSSYSYSWEPALAQFGSNTPYEGCQRQDPASPAGTSIVPYYAGRVGSYYTCYIANTATPTDHGSCGASSTSTTYRRLCRCSIDPSPDLVPPGAWVLGSAGASCSSACEQKSMTCDDGSDGSSSWGLERGAPPLEALALSLGSRCAATYISSSSRAPYMTSDAKCYYYISAGHDHYPGDTGCGLASSSEQRFCKCL